jgi:hypothetical protein
VDILRRGFSIWGYVWPLAYLWAAWKGIAQGDQRMKLLLVWIALPLLVFSAAQTKLGWYINMVYPAIALLLGLTLVELLTERWALGLVAVVMVICCLRVPAPADGSRDVKQFALQALQLIIPGEPLYVSRDICTPQTRVFSSHAPSIEVESIRPALRFYMDRPLTCIEERQLQAGPPLRHAQIITPHSVWSRLGQPGRVVFEGHGFVLTRWD